MKIAEIFPSIHGEVNGHHQGMMCTFIRISGCNLKCWYCDTKHTQDSNYGTEMSTLQIINKVQEYRNKHVCLTGGEPLLYKNEILHLLFWLHNEHFLVSVETNGTIDITPFFRYVDSFVIDYKIGVKNYKKFALNFLNLRKKDVIKLVISKNNLSQGIDTYHQLQKIYEKNTVKPIFAFSPILSEDFTGKDLYYYLKDNGIHDVVISLQIHKMIDLQ